jgi:hypothetical protein
MNTGSGACKSTDSIFVVNKSTHVLDNVGRIVSRTPFGIVGYGWFSWPGSDWFDIFRDPGPLPAGYILL